VYRLLRRLNYSASQASALGTVAPASIEGIYVMDRDEAIKLLTGGAEGIEECNRRREAGEEVPCLRGDDFVGTSLSGADFVWTNISEANLLEADLSRANLSWADLSSADLIEANNLLEAAFARLLRDLKTEQSTGVKSE
jgi:hypothetical protein